MSALINKIRASVIGDNQLVQTPFGDKPLVYADYTASGRSLTFIEDTIRDKVMPFYANTHTESSLTGAVTTSMREEARQIIHQAVNGSNEHKVIFSGAGATSANQKLIQIMGLQVPGNLSQEHDLLASIPEADRPVVFIGSYEHHSNELPWRESLAEVVVIPLDENGTLDLHVLEAELNEYKDRSLKIGSFSAASNVTGLKTDVAKVSALLHRYGALSFWDYAAAAPYVTIDVSGSQENGEDTSLDAVFISTHKFIGGPGSPGILVLKESIAKNTVPSTPGGGTVSFVTPERHRYVDCVVRREEGGTPAIIESIRAGLVFKLKQDVGSENIQRLEETFLTRALARWRNNPNIRILGSLDAKRLSILSFAVQHQGKDLHYGFIVALMNDLFGIQVRGGCSCAGPYAHHLLGLDADYSDALEQAMLGGEMVMRPGWVRLNFNYFIDEATFEYLLRAVELVAEHGWRMYPYYEFDKKRGLWCYQGKPMFKNQGALSAMDFSIDTQSGEADKVSTQEFSRYLQAAEEELLSDSRDGERYDLDLSTSAQKLKWFVTPQEVGL